jgi:hypothetical protein
VTNTLLKMEGGQWKWDLQRLLQPAEYWVICMLALS